MKKQLNLKLIIGVRCPTCGADSNEKCELSTGLPRTQPHRDRRWIAADQASAKLFLMKRPS